MENDNGRNHNLIFLTKLNGPLGLRLYVLKHWEEPQMWLFHAVYNNSPNSFIMAGPSLQIPEPISKKEEELDAWIASIAATGILPAHASLAMKLLITSAIKQLNHSYTPT